jgi:PAS domain S-box-containing protein
MQNIPRNFPLKAFLLLTLLLIACSLLLPSWGVATFSLLAVAFIFWDQARKPPQKNDLDIRFRACCENAVPGMASIPPGERGIMANPALCKLLGYTEEEFRQMNWLDLIPPEDTAETTRRFADMRNGMVGSYEKETRLLRKDASPIDVSVAIHRVLPDAEHAEQFIAFVEDITERQRAREALRQSEERLRLLIDNLPDSYIYQYTRDKDGHPRFTHISSGVRRIHGIEPADVLRNPDSLMRLADAGQIPAMLATEAESRRNMGNFSFQLRIRLANNQWGHVQLHSRPRHTSDDEIIWDGLATDVTSQQQNDELLNLQARRSDAMLALPRLADALDEREFMQQALHLAEDLTDSAISFIHFVHEDGQSIELVAWSRNTLERYCQAAYDNHYPVEKAGLWADAARQMQPVVINDYANASGKKGLPEGHSPLIRLISVPVIEEGRVRMILGVGNKAQEYNDTDVETVQLIGNEAWRIVGSRRADQALRIATQVVNASPAVCFRWRAENGWPAQFVSDNVIQWGYLTEDLIAGKPSFREIVAPEDLTRVCEEIEGYTVIGMDSFVQEYRLLTADNEAIWVVSRTKVVRRPDGTPEYYDSVVTDISERKQHEQKLADNLAAQRTLNKRLEEAHNQLLQSEKMASIGQLAAGIAHELNNPIGFVHSNMGTLEAYVRDMIDIIDAYDQLKMEAGSSLSFEGVERLKEEKDFSYIRDDIGQLLDESKDGLSRVRKIVQDLKSFSHVGEQEWQMADLHQGLDSTLNIVWNELKYKCKVTKEYGELPLVHCLISQLNQVFMNLLVNAGHAIEKQGEITIRTALRGEEEVQIEIIDTGKGISPENINRIFEPFFTTKPVGKGTGLGLSLSWGIVQRHHGRIEVESELGKGSCFRIILPIHPAAHPTSSAEHSA